MANLDSHKSTMKSISKLLSQSSQSFLSAFLDDTKDKKLNQQAQSQLLKQLQVASAQKNLVVLQLKESPTAAKFETVSGWIISKNFSDTLMLRLQENEQQIRMIPIAHIQKVSSLALDKTEEIR